MIHFAYPNAKTKDAKFLGCGRFIALDTPCEGYRIADPRISNAAKVTAAASLLAPESREAERILYERRDDWQAFEGNSQDFAYLLALISRSRPVALREIPGDIWCTGSLELLDGKRPFLNDVNADGFDLKLHAFLADKQTDTLFLLPDANIQPRHDALLRNAGIPARSLAQFRKQGGRLAPEQKTILKICGHEVPDLVSLLFETPGNINAKAFQPQSPYRGLFAFQEADAELFFGRDREIERIVEALRSKRMAALLGASGMGKSSIVYAGVIPRLRQDARWQIVSFRPNANPFFSISAELIRNLSPNAGEIELIEQGQTLSRKLQDGVIGLDDTFRRLASAFPHSQTLLIIDQFEELYTLCHDDELRIRFLNELLRIEECHLPVSCLLTMRADFLGKALQDASFAKLAQDRSIWLGAMGREELRETIEKPARVYGIALEPHLTERILNAVGSHSGNLPLLEFALTEMWQKQTALAAQDHSSNALLTHAAYDQIGGVEQALAQYAERVYHGLSGEEQDAARKIFLQLVHPGQGTEDTRRIATFDEIGQSNWPVVITLADARLVVTNRDRGRAGQETVEVIHEALLTRWQRLRGWLDADREFRAWQERLRAVMPRADAKSTSESSYLRGLPLSEAEEWLRARGAELREQERAFIRASLRERRALQYKKRLGVFTAFIGTLVMAGVFLWLWRDAERQRHRAVEQKQMADASTFQALSASATALYLSHDHAGAVMAIIKAANMLGTFHLDNDVRKIFFTRFKDILQNVRERVRLDIHQASVTTIAYHPQTQRLLSGDADGVIHLLNVRDWRRERTFRLATGMALSAAFSPDGELCAVGASTGMITVWKTENETPLYRRALHADAVNQISFHPTQPLLASIGDDGTVAFCNLRDPEQPPSFLKAHEKAGLALAFNPNGSLLASCGEDGAIILWETATRQQRATYQDGAALPTRLQFVPNTDMLAVGFNNGQLALWNLVSGAIAQRVQAHNQFVGTLDVNADGTLLLSGGEDNTLKLWTLPNIAEYARFTGYSDAEQPEQVYTARFADDHDAIFSGGTDRTIRVWSREVTTQPFASAEEMLAFACAWIDDTLRADSSAAYDEYRRICRERIK